jgi:hypothetical protein
MLRSLNDTHRAPITETIDIRGVMSFSPLGEFEQSALEHSTCVVNTPGPKGV